jgi:hypothetical protein
VCMTGRGTKIFPAQSLPFTFFSCFGEVVGRGKASA